jgi:hypothetical protein
MGPVNVLEGITITGVQATAVAGPATAVVVIVGIHLGLHGKVFVKGAAIGEVCASAAVVTAKLMDEKPNRSPKQ